MEPIAASHRIVLAECDTVQLTLGAPGAWVTGASVTSALVASVLVDSSVQSFTPHAPMAYGGPATSTAQSRNPPRQSTP